MTTSRIHLRGFASLSIERRREIAQKGGRAAHEQGTAHEWTSEEARAAGRKGGLKTAGKKKGDAAVAPANVA